MRQRKVKTNFMGLDAYLDVAWPQALSAYFLPNYEIDQRFECLVMPTLVIEVPPLSLMVTLRADDDAHAVLV